MRYPLELLFRIPPARLAFLGSLLLSLVAVAGTIIAGRDAALYLHVAAEAVERGPRVAFGLFQWPWFSLLLAGSHWLLGLPIEMAAYLWCAVFMAGTCAVLVSITERSLPASGYWACLVVLSAPAFNTLRYDIIREFGFWFFCTLALWLTVDWLRRGGWLKAASIQLAVGLAALFRLEAVFLIPVLFLCLLPDLTTRQGWIRLLQVNTLCLAGILIVSAFVLLGQSVAQPRIVYYLQLLNPTSVLARFELMAGGFAKAALQPYATGDARQIVLFGLSLTVLAKFFTLSGPFAVPFLYRPGWLGVRDYWRDLRPLAWAWCLYFCVLMLFFVQLGFLNARYVSFLNLLAVPMLTMVLMRFARRFPRSSKVLVMVALLVMLHNVIPFGAKKTQYLEASAWLSAHTQTSDGIFYDDSRIAYYAGRGYPSMPVTREQLMTAEVAQKYRYFVFVARPDDAALRHLLEKQGKRTLVKFANRKGDTVLIVGD